MFALLPSTRRELHPKLNIRIKFPFMFSNQEDQDMCCSISFGHHRPHQGLLPSFCISIDAESKAESGLNLTRGVRATGRLRLDRRTVDCSFAEGASERSEHFAFISFCRKIFPLNLISCTRKENTATSKCMAHIYFRFGGEKISGVRVAGFPSLTFYSANVSVRFRRQGQGIEQRETAAISPSIYPLLLRLLHHVRQEVEKGFGSLSLLLVTEHLKRDSKRAAIQKQMKGNDRLPSEGAICERSCTTTACPS